MGIQIRAWAPVINPMLLLQSTRNKGNALQQSLGFKVLK